MDWYRPVLFGLNLFSTVIFILFPILSVGILFFCKRRRLWMAPILSTVCSMLLGMLVIPSVLQNKEYGGMFFGIVIPMELGIVLVLTLLAYGIAYLPKHKPGTGK